MWYILFIGMALYIGEDIYRTVKERRRYMILRIVNNVLVMAADVCLFIPDVHPVVETVASIVLFWWLGWKLAFVLMDAKKKEESAK